MQHYINTHNLTDLDKTGYASYKSKRQFWLHTMLFWKTTPCSLTRNWPRRSRHQDSQSRWHVHHSARCQTIISRLSCL